MPVFHSITVLCLPDTERFIAVWLIGLDAHVAAAYVIALRGLRKIRVALFDDQTAAASEPVASA